ncbi:hypothetical protein BCM27_14715 [Gordonia terrae]|nr:hypothetical protein BCM27_14715 [Gordonia terrae]
MGRAVTLLVTVAMFAMLAGCAKSVTPSAGTEPIPGISPDLIAAAQREGQVVLAGGGHTRTQLEQLKVNFEERFGVELSYVRADSGSTVNAVNSELASGRVNSDVVSLADPISMKKWDDEGILKPVAISNQDQIIDGLDAPDSAAVPFAVVPMGIMYNEAAIPGADVPVTWEQFVQPSDRLTISADPRASGSALAFYTAMVADHGQQWLRSFGATHPLVTDSTLGLNQLVLTGEADYGIPALESGVLTSAKEGEPLRIAYPDGPIPATTLIMSALAAAPHPAAAELLMRYSLSDEFQGILGDGGTRGVLRDLPPPPNAPQIDPARLRPVTVDELADAAQPVRAEFRQEVAE